MSAVTASQQMPAVEQPEHPLGALTTYVLRCAGSVPAVRDELQAKLDAVTAEQDSRSRIAGG